MADKLVIADLHSLGQSEAIDILARIARIERKTFPSNEALSFTPDLWRKKPNTTVLYMMDNAPAALAAYAVYVRQKGLALLHKICVAEPYRRKGAGQRLVQYIQQRLQKEGCQCIQLWVDKNREPARRLYLKCGFVEREEVPDYYAPGRTGIRMVYEIRNV
ncbi:hypothetical protein VTN31DRAFT_6659 [Thermomyces dupontii]|uniref:uncharacterized protein n=1 Tax=Talaromyces thermophilus TaxID=28565 RepID=UPI003742A742